MALYARSLEYQAWASGTKGQSGKGLSADRQAQRRNNASQKLCASVPL